MSEPKLEQYPGYYPAGSRPFWSRAKVAVVASVTGLTLGIVGGGSDGEPAEAAQAPTSGPSVSELQADLDQALSAKADLSDQLREQTDDAVKDSAQAAKAAAIAQKKAVRKAVSRARQEEQKKAATAIRAAEAKALAAAAAPAAIAPLAAPQPSTDPRFSYCYEANAAGYGPYYQGQDPEYGWYDDRDGDGIVCEY